MTLGVFTNQAIRVQQLNGEECVRAEIGYGRSLLLDFGRLHPPDSSGYQEPEKSLVADCPWRAERHAEIIVGSGDDQDGIDGKLALCVGKRVTEIAVYRPSFMLRIQMAGGVTIWFFPDDAREYAAESEYPRSAWYVTGRSFPEGWEA